MIWHACQWKYGLYDLLRTSYNSTKNNNAIITLTYLSYILYPHHCYWHRRVQLLLVMANTKIVITSLKTRYMSCKRVYITHASNFFKSSNPTLLNALSFVLSRWTFGTNPSLSFDPSGKVFAYSAASLHRPAHRHHLQPSLRPIWVRSLPRLAENFRKDVVRVATGLVSHLWYYTVSLHYNMWKASRWSDARRDVPATAWLPTSSGPTWQ